MFYDKQTYPTAVLGFAMIIMAFFGNIYWFSHFRNSSNDGVIAFGKTFNIGFLIAFVASTLYVIALRYLEVLTIGLLLRLYYRDFQMQIHGKQE